MNFHAISYQLSAISYQLIMKTTFVKPADIVGQAGLKYGQKVADFGCGAGFFTLPAARLVGDEGVVYAVDIMPDRLAVTQSSAQQAGLKNVQVVQADRVVFWYSRACQGSQVGQAVVGY